MLPPPRVVPVLILTIIAALAAALVWSSVSVLDVYTNAAGRVRSTVPSAVVQPQESGRVTAINVANGKAIKASDALLVLDDVAVLSALDAAEAGRLSWLAEVTRRKAAMQAVEENRFDLPEVAYDPAIPQAVTIRDAQGLQDPNALATGQAAAQPNGIPSVSGLYYIARITLESTEIKTTHRTLKLEPGMTVRAEIKTEIRSVIDYILSPISQVISETGHER